MQRCDYDLFIAASGSSVAPSKGLTTQLRSQGDSSSISRSLELRLLHHYTTLTSLQMPAGSKQIWSVDLPRLGFECEQVLNGILGVSAQHLWALVPHDQSLAHASRYYLGRAILEHKSSLSQTDRRSAEGVLAAAILITHQVWTAAHSESENGSYSLPLQTYHMARGIISLSEQLFPWLKGSEYLWYVEPGVISGEGSLQQQAWKDGERDLDAMEAFLGHLDLDSSDVTVYKATLDDLRVMHKSIRAGQPQASLQRMVATMPVRLPARFLQLLENHDSFALALLARNLALLKVIDPVWWLHGAGDHLVTDQAVHGILGLLPPNWKWSTEWPLKVISGEITLDD